MEIERNNKAKKQEESYVLKLDEVVYPSKTNYEVYYELWDGAGAEEETYIFDTYSEAREYFRLSEEC